MPMPQREDLMNLDVIQGRDTLRGRIWCNKDESLSLKTSDINHRGARPAGAQRYLQKPDSKTPYDGCKARTHYPPRAPYSVRPTDMSLTTRDIVGATPGLLQDKVMKTDRVTNPINPMYSLPSSEVADPGPVQTRFNGRETNDISDIDFTSPRKAFPSRNNLSNSLDISDIKGSAPNQFKARERPYQYEEFGLPKPPTCRPICSLDPEYPIRSTNATSIDVQWTEEAMALPSSGPRRPSIDAPRNTSRSPLQPMNGSRPSSRSPDYQSHEIGTKIGPVAGSKPRPLHQGNGRCSLHTQDVQGATSQRWVGKTKIHMYGPPPARPCFHDTHDVPGAQSDTVYRGIEWSSRKINALEPSYPEMRGSTHKHHPGAEIIEGERGHINLRRRMIAASG